MLVLMCQAGAGRYAFDARAVQEVVSSVRLQSVKGLPDWIAGLFVYRGRPTPVVDLTYLATGQCGTPRWSNRILMVTVAGGETPRLFGLLTERVTTAQLAEPAGQDDNGAVGVSGWGSVLLDDQGLFQLIALPRLLSPERHAALFSATGEKRG